MGYPVTNLAPTHDAHGLATQFSKLQIALVMDPFMVILRADQSRHLSGQGQKKAHAVLGHRNGVHPLGCCDGDVAPPDRQFADVIDSALTNWIHFNSGVPSGTSSGTRQVKRISAFGAAWRSSSSV